MIHEGLSCLHCSDHPCYDKCPKKDSAMCLDENNIVYIAEENCIGCGLCLKACAADTPRINFVKSEDRSGRKARKYDFCRSRPEKPACIRWCPVRCIGLSENSAGDEQDA